MLEPPTKHALPTHINISQFHSFTLPPAQHSSLHSSGRTPHTSRDMAASISAHISAPITSVYRYFGDINISAYRNIGKSAYPHICISAYPHIRIPTYLHIHIFTYPDQISLHISPSSSEYPVPRALSVFVRVVTEVTGRSLMEKESINNNNKLN